MGKNEWIQLIERTGFPIVVAFYFMFRMERVLDRVVLVLTELQLTIAQISP